MQTEGEVLGSDLGRPTVKKPKEIIVKARIDKDMYDRIMKYCLKNHKTVTDVIRIGIDMLLMENN